MPVTCPIRQSQGESERATVGRMYYVAIQQFIRTLRNLDAIMAKAESYAEARKFDVNNFCSARMFPDMLPFPAQIRIACDTAKGAAAGLAGIEAPRHEDDEKTFAELRGRVAKCVAFLESVKPEQVEQTTPKTKVKLPGSANKTMYAEDYLFSYRIPNFFFHVTTAYNILRHGGVEVGKKDYYGALNVLES